MSNEIQTRRGCALDFLDELDARHELLLAELEQLNQRLDLVLSEYSRSRQSAASADGRLADVDTFRPLLHVPVQIASQDPLACANPS